jgi:hypothetical protein
MHDELNTDQDLNSFADYDDDDVIMQDTIVLDYPLSDTASDSLNLQDEAICFPNLSEDEGLAQVVEVEWVGGGEHDEITNEDLIQLSFLINQVLLLNIQIPK